jgi:hypothetical protein
VSKISVAVQGALGTAYGNVFTNMEGSGVLGGQTPMIYRQKTTAGAAHLLAISGYTVNFVYATQRRRLRKAPHH